MRLELRPGSSISHYRVGAKIGEGGMGIVYEARDERLRRRVALKVLSTDVVGNEERRARFLREARAAAAVTHPNIATVYEVDEADGQPFLAMELVDGGTLRGVLKKRGRLAIEEALRLAAGIADGLACAHESRIVHRDLKPENILIGRDGQPKILDFGLAKVLQDDFTAPFVEPTQVPSVTAELTRRGTILGTVAYMSPEQARGETVDRRSDLFSFGIILYEMVTGRRPFTGMSPMAVLAAIMGHEPTPASALNTDVPRQLDETLTRCLAKTPERRYPSAADVARDLRRILGTTAPAVEWRRRLGRVWSRWRWVAVGAVVVVPASIGLLSNRSSTFDLGPRIESIAVLPFENQSGDPNQAYFADGMTEALSGELERLAGIRVISKTSSMRFKDSDRSLPEIAWALGVDAVLEGSAVRAGNRVGVTVRLIEAQTDRPLWSGSFERNVRDVLTLRNELARTVAREIRVETTAREEQNLKRVEDVDPRAYDEYLRGQYVLANDWSGAGAREAIAHFERAVAVDDGFAPAWAGLAITYSLAVARFPSDVVIAKAIPAATRALELDPSLGEAYAALGQIKFLHEADWIGPEREFRRALERSPNSSWVHQCYAFYLVLAGRSREGVEHARKAVELDPLTPMTNLQLGWAYMLSRRPQEAIAQHHRVLALLRDSPDPLAEYWVHYQLAIDYIFAGQYEQAVEESDLAGEPFTKIWANHLSGRTGEAREMLEHVGEDQPFFRGVTYAVLGDPDRAFEWLDRALSARDPALNWIKVVPFFDPMRTDPRYADLLARAGIPLATLDRG